MGFMDFGCINLKYSKKAKGSTINIINCISAQHKYKCVAV